MSNLSDDDAENAALELRKTLEVDHLLQMDMIRVLDELKRQGILKDWIVVADSEMRGAEGRFLPEQGIILTTSTAEAARQGQPRANFTIAHEVGHLIGGVSETRNRGAIQGNRTRHDESFANRFAATFLAPFHKARFNPKTSIDEIRRRFNISTSAAKFRHEEFSRLYRTLNRVERPLPGVVVDFLEEARSRGKPVRSIPEKPKTTPKSRDHQSPPSPSNPSERTVGNSCFCGSLRVDVTGSTKIHCLDCRATYDRFQDGDSAAS